MDDELTRLERRLRADPADAEAGAAYERALLRGEQRERLADHHWFRLRCDQRWEGLEETGDPLVRRCARCARDVHFAWSVEELTRHAQAGRCVALAAPRARRLVRELARAQTTPLAARRLPCVVQGESSALTEAVQRKLTAVLDAHEADTVGVLGMPQPPAVADRLYSMLQDLRRDP